MASIGQETAAGFLPTEIGQTLEPTSGGSPAIGTLRQNGGPWSTIPPLENGDHLTRAEFERRYDAMPDLRKAELIEGAVYVGSHVTAIHGQSHARLIGWLSLYSIAIPSVDALPGCTLRLDEDNVLQPDGMLRIDSDSGGRSRVDEDSYVAGPPELAGEIAVSTASYDLHSKMHVFRRSGVLEYIVWRVRDADLDWFVLREGNYERLPPDDQGVLHSEVFPGLWLNKPAMLRMDLAAVLATLQLGLATPEHAAFDERLKAAAREKRQGQAG